MADDGLEPAGDQAERAQWKRHDLGQRRLLANGMAGGGASLVGIGLLAAEDGGAVVFVALRIAAGDTASDLRA
jgi:hypothetical protein